MELELGQLYLIGLIASLLAQIVKLVSTKLGWRPGRVVITIVAFVISVGLAWLWAPPTLPSVTDPMALAQAIASIATSLLGAAVLIYNVLLEKLLEAIGQKLNVSLTP